MEQGIQNCFPAAPSCLNPDPSAEQVLCYVDVIHCSGKDPFSLPQQHIPPDFSMSAMAEMLRSIVKHFNGVESLQA